MPRGESADESGDLQRELADFLPAAVARKMIGAWWSGDLAEWIERMFDDDSLRFADFANDFNREFSIDTKRTAAVEEDIHRALTDKAPGEIDTPAVQWIKAMIRRGEARAAGRACGLSAEQLLFLDMPGKASP